MKMLDPFFVAILSVFVGFMLATTVEAVWVRISSEWVVFPRWDYYRLSTNGMIFTIFAAFLYLVAIF